MTTKIVGIAHPTNTQNIYVLNTLMLKIEIEKLHQEKIEARMKLQQLPPKEAQNLVNQTLYPQWWHMDLSSHTWEETIPINYEQTDT